ncbi:MAG: DNA primase [Desulfobacterales bacterium]
MRIPEDTITDIKNATNIVDVVSEAVLLKKQGKNYIGLCPFHSEKTPSFTVSAEKQIFHCFGCASGGNAFSFLMQHEGLSFPEAVRQLAQRCGVTVPSEPMTPDQKRRMSEKDAIFEVNQKAMEFFHQRLRDNGGKNPAMDYLNKRGMTDQTIDQFRLGYAPPGWEILSQQLMQQRVPRAAVERSGLIVPRKEKSGHYDRFRDRIMFPIFDGNKRVIGFGGRAMDDTPPKYLNSPETPVYHKSRSLYGLYDAKKRSRETNTVYIVEGYFDFLSLYQNGIHNVVATLGTALTSEHLRLLKGYAGTAMLVYDSDAAGVKAAMRSIGLFIKEGVDARIVILPTGYDPDAYVTEFGPEKFTDASAAALGLIPFLVETTIKKHGPSIEGKIRVIEELKEPLSAIEDRTAQSLYIKNLAEAIGVDEAAIREKVGEHSGKRTGRGDRDSGWPRGVSRNPRQSGNPQGSSLLGEKGFREGGIRFERQIISMMLQFSEILPEISARGILERFRDDMLESIGDFILANFPQLDGDVSQLVDLIDDSGKRNMVTQLAFSDNQWSRKGCLDLLTQFESSRFHRKNDLLQEIKSAEASNDYELLAELLKKKQHEAVKAY